MLRADGVLGQAGWRRRRRRFSRAMDSFGSPSRVDVEN